MAKRTTKKAASRQAAHIDVETVKANALIQTLIDKADLPKSKAVEVVSILQNIT